MMHNIIAQPSTFFKKKFFIKAGPLNENLKYCFDLELWVRGSFLFKYKSHPKIFSKFRYHNQSKTVSQSLHMSKEAAEATIGVLEEKRAADISINKYIRLRNLNLAVWQWRIDKNDSKKIQAYLYKADINENLFDIDSISHFVRPFLDLEIFQIQPIDYRKLGQGISDIKEFYRIYIQPYFFVNPDKYLTTIISFAYLKIFLEQRKILFLLKAILLNPAYVFQMVRLRLLNHPKRLSS